MEDWIRVLVRQWSWKNDKSMVGIFFLTSALFMFILHLTGSITVTPDKLYLLGILLYQFLWFLTALGIYHVTKLIILGCILGFVCYCRNKGNTHAVDFYEEAMYWRK